MASNTQIAAVLPTSGGLQKEGNELYWSGKSAEAYEKYQQAARLAPNDPTLKGNLSAASYELGNYRKCIEEANAAIAVSDAEVSKDLIERLQQRIVQAKKHLFNPSDGSQIERRIALLKEFGRYQGSMHCKTDYFAVGNDNVSSLYNPDLFAPPKAGDPALTKLSYFFGGVGDARHLLQTLIVIAQAEKDGKAPQRQYHFTANDIHPAMLARCLVVWLLLDELSKVKANTMPALRILNTVFFVFISTVMPKYAYDQLHKTIEKALQYLKSDQQPLNWVHIAPEDFSLYISVLERWKARFDKDDASFLTMTEVRTIMFEQDAFGFFPELNGRCGKERLLYSSCAFLCPSMELLRHSNTTLLDLWRKISIDRPENLYALVKHMIRYWRTNTTLLDVHLGVEVPGEEAWAFGFNPFAFLDSFDGGIVSNPADTTQPFDPFARFFSKAANAITSLHGRFTVEVLCGDYADVAEKMHFGLYRQPGSGFTRKEEFPDEFDGIHLSNVPDYMMGNLSTHLFAMPIVQRRSGAFVRMSCRRNLNLWTDLESYLADYQQIPTREMLEQLTQMRIGISPPNLLDYTYYHWSKAGPHSHAELLPRRDFTKWFHGLFFRLALPFKLDIDNMNRAGLIAALSSPLNMSILFRLIPQLIETGYPGHWLSDILDEIFENNLSTQARPPRESPVPVGTVEQWFPKARLSTGPFLHEMATLARLFQPLLPFEITSKKVPRLEEIHKYTFDIVNYLGHQPRENNLALLFVSTRALNYLGAQAQQRICFSDFHPVLDPSWVKVDDKIFNPPLITAFRDRGIVIWTSIHFDLRDEKASAWMDDRFVDKCKEEEWIVTLVRKDSWRLVGDPKPVHEVMTTGKGFPVT